MTKLSDLEAKRDENRPKEIPISIINERFYVDDEGNVRNKTLISYNSSPYMIAGSIVEVGRGLFYRRITVNRARFQAHRIAWVLYYGEWPAGKLDHIDGNGLNNKITNLRMVTSAENSKNCKMNSKNKSGVNGVCWERRQGQWKAQICVNHKVIFLGHFRTLLAAAYARHVANLKYDFHPNHGRK